MCTYMYIISSTMISKWLLFIEIVHKLKHTCVYNYTHTYTHTHTHTLTTFSESKGTHTPCLSKWGSSHIRMYMYVGTMYLEIYSDLVWPEWQLYSKKTTRKPCLDTSHWYVYMQWNAKKNFKEMDFTSEQKGSRFSWINMEMIPAGGDQNRYPSYSYNVHVQVYM